MTALLLASAVERAGFFIAAGTVVAMIVYFVVTFRHRDADTDLRQEIELLALLHPRLRTGCFKVQNGVALRSKKCSLKRSRNKAARPIRLTTDGPAPFVQHDHIARQVLILGTKSIRNPTTHRWSTDDWLAGVHLY